MITRHYTLLALILSAALWADCASASVPVPEASTPPGLEGGSRTATAGAAESQAAIWNPATTKLCVQLQVYASGTCTVGVDGQSKSFSGGGCGTLTDSGPLLFNDLKTRKKLTLTVMAGQLDAVTLTFIPDISVELVKKKGVKANVKTFKIYADGDETYQITDSGQNPCGAYQRSWTIELRPDSGIREADESDLTWTRAEQNLGEDAASGDAAWPELGPGKSTNAAAMSFKWGVNVGRLLTGREAGQIRLRETNLAASSFAPISLLYTMTSTNRRELTVVTNTYYLTNQYGTNIVISTNGILRQVKGPLALANVTTNTAWQYFIKFYTTNWITSQDTNGLCTLSVSAAPFVSYTVESPNQTTNWLRITESRNQSNYVSDLRFDAAGPVWRLTNGLVNVSGQFVDSQAISRSVVSSPANSNRVETVEYKNTGGTTAFKSAEKYQQFDWGWELVQVTNNLGVANLVTTYGFYTSSTNIAAKGKLYAVTYPDGSWEKREYIPLLDADGYPNEFPGLLWRIYRPWKDGPAGPDQATLLNSWVSEYNYGNHERSVYVSSLVHFYDPGDLGIRVQTSSRQERFNEGLNTSAEGDQYRTESVELGGTSGYGDISFTDTYTLLAGTDLADQPYSQHYTNGVQQVYFYDWGFFNSTTGVFTTATTNLVHWRLTSVVSGDPWTWAPGDGPGVHTSYLDGKAIDYSYLVPRQSTKETKIMQDGKVIVRENWVIKAYDAGNDAFTSELLDQFLQSHDSLGHVTNIVRRDPNTGSLRTIYAANWKDANGLDGNLKRSETGEEGTETTFTYDGLKRVQTVTRKGVTAPGFPAQGDIATTYAYDAYGRKLSEAVGGGGLYLTNSFTYDLAGRVLTQTATNALTTSLAYTDNGLTETATLPGGAARATARYKDGRQKSVTGSAVVANYFNYLINTNNQGQYYSYAPHNIKTTEVGSLGSARWQRAVTDLREMMVEEHAPGLYGVITNQYLHDERGLPAGFAQPLMDFLWAGWTGGPNPPADTLVRRLEYEKGGAILGNTNFAYLDDQPLGYPDPQSSRELVENRSWYETDGSKWWRVSTNFVYLTDGSTNATLQSAFKEQLTGLGATTQSILSQIDADTNTTTVTVTIDLTNKKVTEVTDTPQSTLNATNITLNGLLVQESTPTVASPTLYYYDGLARVVRVQSPLGFNSGTQYDPATGQVTAATNATGQVTTYEYYTSASLNAGRLKCQTEANGKKTYFDYTARGESQHVWGDVPSPLERKYSSYGELTNLVTFRGGSGWSSATWPGGSGDNTYWNYDGASGWLLSKTDAQNRSVSYGYCTNGFERIRTWARGGSVTRQYNNSGDLVGLDYSDATPDVTYTNFNRSGQPRSRSDATGSHTLAYDHASRQVGDTCVSGTFSGLTVSNRFDRVGGVVYGRTRVSAHGASATLQDDYGFDTYGRIGSVTNGSFAATYGYLPNSDLLQTTASKSSGATVLTATRTWDFGVRLRSIQNIVGTSTSPLAGFSYAYDAVNRRTGASLADNSAWTYDYDDRNELVSGRRSWADFSPVAGQQFGYAYDNLGNRTNTLAGGDANGANQRATPYTVNSLNQYSSRKDPAAADVAGVATATATVTLNGQATARKGEYYWKELALTNSAAPAWTPVSVPLGRVETLIPVTSCVAEVTVPLPVTAVPPALLLTV